MLTILNLSWQFFFKYLFSNPLYDFSKTKIEMIFNYGNEQVKC